MNTRKLKNLFLRQSCVDAWEEYRRSLQRSNHTRWDYIILTASNEIQASTYEAQIRMRVENGQLPRSTRYAVLPDEGGRRVGSGGATFNVLRYIAEQSEGGDPFEGKRILVIHSGGDSKRIPQYSAVGKLFSPVPCELPDGRKSTLFDEFMIGMAGMPGRFRDGMLVLSGDVLLLFNPLQIDANYHGAAALSIKESVSVGKNHGVFLDDGSGYVTQFLHKQTEETLTAMGAVNRQGSVNLDTGAVLLDSELLNALYGLISTDGRPDPEKLGRFMNERARVSFYGDMLYPLARDSTLEQYYREKPEGDYTEELRQCRTQLWQVLRAFSLKLFCLSPAQFIHFGTTRELLQLMTEGIEDYEFLRWKYHTGSTVTDDDGDRTRFSSYNAYIGHQASVGDGCFIEDSYVLGESAVGGGSIVSNVKLRDRHVPGGVVLHGLPLDGGRFTVRVYGVRDNPKGTLEDGVALLGGTLARFIENAGASEQDFWDGGVRELWTARLFPVCKSMEEALDWAMAIIGLAAGTPCPDYLAMPRISLRDSAAVTDMDRVVAWRDELEHRILCNRFIERIAAGECCHEALKVFGDKGITEEIFRMLEEDAENADFSLRIRIYYAISRYMKAHRRDFSGMRYDAVEGRCFSGVREAVGRGVAWMLPEADAFRIVRDAVDVNLPVRVNWGGGWTDTPPYCNERGGVVLNAAISLRGILPIQVSVRRLEQYRVEFESQDVGAHGTIRDIREILDCHNPYDPFALHKAALISVGLVRDGGEPLEELLRRIGGGIYLSTQVVGVPKGSGLGTSSILSGACVRALFEFFGIHRTEDEVFSVVLNMEQIMSTGGGWQDQVGGLTPGIKFITSRPGLRQDLRVDRVAVPEAAMRELSERFALIYTGQRRLARNLLRDVVGGYIGALPSSTQALDRMKSVAALMRFYLEQGDIDRFAQMLNEHWQLSIQLDAGTTNSCIDQIFAVCEDMIDGRFIAGAGGGGFLMVILKRGVTRQMLHERLNAVFEDSGVDVWESAFV